MNIPQLIQQYERGASVLPLAIQGLSRQELQATPVPGTWSIAQITIHLMDSDLVASDRMKRIIAEDNPTIIGFDETKFANNLFYDKLDPFLAADIFRKNRQLTSIILQNLPDAAFLRVGTHNQAGVLTLEQMVQAYVDHLENHLKHLHHKRKLLGRPAANDVS